MPRYFRDALRSPPLSAHRHKVHYVAFHRHSSVADAPSDRWIHVHAHTDSLAAGFAAAGGRPWDVAFVGDHDEFATPAHVAALRDGRVPAAYARFATRWWYSGSLRCRAARERWVLGPQQWPGHLILTAGVSLFAARLGWADWAAWHRSEAGRGPRPHGWVVDQSWHLSTFM
eukprot:gene7448-biopygen1185